ncbi:MAG TPA: NADH-quinone oxidoreductase subunit L [Coxiellaceae bacterium]|nr:NADH-quinone oxidoreductase subunit L [Coxiellaceae bacterium]
MIETIINNIPLVSLLTVLAPLVGATMAGLGGRYVGRWGAHTVTILGIFISLVGSVLLFKDFVIDGHAAMDFNLYSWAESGAFNFSVGFLLDNLTVIMLVVVNFVSLLVHIYSIGYMEGDPGYQRFFAYMSLFTFMMLTLVLANNFMQLFFGWEGVGLVSYLLIGFWFKKESAANGSFKAFLVNRVGDFGFILGIAAVLDYFGTLHYADVFQAAPHMVNTTVTIIGHTQWSLMTVISLLLFVGAMGKSAQIPLHIWLPESMEGPTPISALIHAATMVTAGVYMVARMSPLYELSPVALTVVMVIGATGALFLGLLALVENDIKRVIAYSTMSQLGYMMAANGASAFSASIFHLATHACFKALLFLAAGSVIIAMHHEQDLRKMGGLRKYLPITYTTFLIGSLALAAIPPFAGFYSKDAIIEAVGLSTLPGATYAYYCLLIGSFVTGLYAFRAFFLAFHTQERFSKDVRLHLHEPRWVVGFPLIILAIPSVMLGFYAVDLMLYRSGGLLANSVTVNHAYDVMAMLAEEYHGAWHAVAHAALTAPFWMAVSGVLAAWVAYIWKPELPARIQRHAQWAYRILINKYWFDWLNQRIFVIPVGFLSHFFYQVTDAKMIDGWIVNGSGRSMERLSRLLKRLQTGYLYHYAFIMIIALVALLCWQIVVK